VIEIPDSPPTLDLSDERGDYGLSDIISLAESQTHSAEQNLQPQRHASSSNVTSASQISDNSSHLHHLPTTDAQLDYTTPQKAPIFPAKFMSSPGDADNIDTSAMTSSDTFFPLSVSEDTKPGTDSLVSSMQIDTDIQGNLPILGPGTPNSGTSDSNQGPVLVPNPGMSPGGSTDGGTDGKVGIGFLLNFLMTVTDCLVLGIVMQE
jgi:hypothetical protein